MKYLAHVLLLNCALAPNCWAGIETTKREILTLASSYRGQGDPDGSKQRSLEVLVEKLLQENPQAPLNERLPLIYGAWKQVWGPYDYRNDNRGVDPEVDPDNIVQVVFDGGYYYNVNPNFDEKGKVRSTSFLRGEYFFDKKIDNVLNVRFTNLRKIDGLPKDGLRLHDLPFLSERGELPGERTVLPWFLVRLFIGGGSVREVYTDHDLRIDTRKSDQKPYLHLEAIGKLKVW
jgi:hypothetical protein